MIEKIIPLSAMADQWPFPPKPVLPMNAREVRRALEAAGFVFSESSGNDDMTVHFDSADAEKKFQGYVESSDGERWQVILLGHTWFIGDECSTPAELTSVFNNMEALLEVAKAQRNAK